MAALFRSRLAAHGARTWARCRNWLLPQDCVLCGEPGLHEPICPGCRVALPILPPQRCPRCALPVPDSSVPCGACQRHPPRFDATHAALTYAFPADGLIRQLKYGHRLATANLLAGLMLEQAPAQGDVLVPVPLSAARLRERGFNQAMELARVLGRRRGLPVDAASCRRIADTPPQAGLSWKERRRNIRNAFACDTDYGGRHVILVDDVMTTGATLDELARTLRQHGAARVTAWVAARTLR